MPPEPSETTAATTPGQIPAFGRLFEEVYGQLRAIAQKQMEDERSGHSLRATELVHQAFLRLLGGQAIDWASQRHLIHAAAEAMRRILIEHARQRARQKRGGDRHRLPLSMVDAPAAESSAEVDADELLALDAALGRMEQKDPRAADVVRLRFFAGLTIEQTAEALNLSPRTVKREWEFARAWLSRSLEQKQIE